MTEATGATATATATAAAAAAGKEDEQQQEEEEEEVWGFDGLSLDSEEETFLQARPPNAGGLLAWGLIFVRFARVLRANRCGRTRIRSSTGASTASGG